MQKNIKIISFIWCLSIYTVFGQGIDSIAFDAAYDTLYFDQNQQESISFSKTAGDQLVQTPGVFLKNFTLGGIQTIAAQGLQNQHIQVLWNDIPVQSGMLGVSDLSLFSVGYKQEVKYALQGQEWATGGIAGVVNIQDVPSQQKGITLGYLQSFGSFGQSLSKIIHTGQYRQHTWSITGGFERAKNNFPFLDYTIFPNQTKYLRNSQYHKWYVYPKWEWKWNENNTLNIFQEVLSNHREVPPFMVTPNNLAVQEDFIARQMLKWKYESSKLNHTVQGLYSYSTLTFHDEVMRRSVKNIEHLSYLRYVLQWRISKNWIINYGSDVKNTFVRTLNYADALQEWGWDTYVSVNYQPTLRWKAKGLLKSTTRSALGWNFPMLLEFNSYLGKNYQWNLWAKMSRDIRYPSLNDRFWEPGGRIDLQPEKSLNSSVGFHTTHQIGNHIFWKHKLYVFANRLEELILWMPTNRGYSQPMNIGKVLAFGTTIEQDIEWVKNKHQISALLSYSFNRSGNMEKRFQNDRSQWIQLPYFPIHSGKLVATYSWNKLKWMVDAQTYSKRIVSRDGDTFIPSYHLLNTSVSYLYALKKIDLEGKISFNNILNERYEEIRYRPMPGRNYLITIFINWKHEKN